jgi:DNA-binding transcriptional ArsR family regulator
MTKKADTAKSEVVIGDVEMLRAISEPLRLKILDLASADPDRSWTAKELAARLATKQTKLYHHLGILETHGFLRVAETRMVSGILEKRYAATGRSFRLDRRLIGSGEEGAAALGGALEAVFETVLDDISTGIRAGTIDPETDPPSPRSMAIWTGSARLSPASVRKVLRQIKRLAEFDERDEPDGTDYGFIVGFYPRADR